MSVQLYSDHNFISRGLYVSTTTYLSFLFFFKTKDDLIIYLHKNFEQPLTALHNTTKQWKSSKVHTERFYLYLVAFYLFQKWE